jgi:hypothetical protein
MDVEDQAGLAGGLSIDQFIVHPMATIRITNHRNAVAAANTNPTPHQRVRRRCGRVRARVVRGVMLWQQRRANSAGYAESIWGAAWRSRAGDDARQRRLSELGQGDRAGRDRFGGGIAMFGSDLTLHRTVVVANSATARRCGAAPFGGVRVARRRHLERRPGFPRRRRP